MSAPAKYISLRIELLHIQPLIWRRLLVPASITLPDLHLAIQGAMGWTDSHLHQFEIDGKSYREPDPYGEIEIIPEKGKKLSAVLGKEVSEFVYQYDYGDDWQHRVVVEQTQKAHPAWLGPLCTAGERACPPEDVGGIYGYQAFLEAIADPQHEEHVHLLRWAGGIFDPEGFDINSANDRIAILLER
jgi:hypothetical protein